MTAADLKCEHCGASLGHSPRLEPTKAIIRNRVIVKNGRVETSCDACGKDSVLPLVFVARPPSPVESPPPAKLTVTRRIAR